MPSARTRDMHPPRLHLGANPMDARQITAPLDDFIAGFAGNRKKLGQRELAILLIDFELLNLREREGSRHVRSQTFDFERNGGRSLELQNQHEGSIANVLSLHNAIAFGDSATLDFPCRTSAANARNKVSRRFRCSRR